MNKSFDVFLSHNSKDKPAVRELAKALRDRGLTVWLDEWELVPGRPWQEALEEVIGLTRASAVLVGKDGLGPWQDAEMRGCLSEFVERKLPVIPVLLPGAPEVPRLPFFLKRFTWVDLRGGLTEEGLDRLQWGITGKRPDRSKPLATPTAAPTVGVSTSGGTVLSWEAAGLRHGRRLRRFLAKERPDQKAWALWGMPAWLGLLALLGITVFLLDHYSSRPSEPEADAQEMSTPSTGEVASSKDSSVPLPAATQTKPAVTALDTCTPREEREENGMVFVRICPGTFTMGSAENDQRADPDEKPAHEVTMSEFWIGKTEITNKQYRTFWQTHQGEDELPVVNVSWAGAQEACEHFGGRLPTEAEWEYAARAGSRTAWSFGDDEKLLGDYAWYEKNADQTSHPVGKKNPNDWGLHDMHGNVVEWVADRYDAYPASVRPDTTGPTAGVRRVLRGGAFYNPPRILRSAFRFAGEPVDRVGVIGFRCVRGPLH